MHALELWINWRRRWQYKEEILDLLFWKWCSGRNAILISNNKYLFSIYLMEPSSVFPVIEILSKERAGITSQCFRQQFFWEACAFQIIYYPNTFKFRVAGKVIVNYLTSNTASILQHFHGLTYDSVKRFLLCVCVCVWCAYTSKGSWIMNMHWFRKNTLFPLSQREKPWFSPVLFCPPTVPITMLASLVYVSLLVIFSDAFMWPFSCQF